MAIETLISIPDGFDAVREKRGDKEFIVIKEKEITKEITKEIESTFYRKGDVVVIERTDSGNPFKTYAMLKDEIDLKDLNSSKDFVTYIAMYDDDDYYRKGMIIPVTGGLNTKNFTFTLANKEEKDLFYKKLEENRLYYDFNNNKVVRYFYVPTKGEVYYMPFGQHEIWTGSHENWEDHTNGMIFKTEEQANRATKSLIKELTKQTGFISM